MFVLMLIQDTQTLYLITEKVNFLFKEMLVCCSHSRLFLQNRFVNLKKKIVAGIILFRTPVFLTFQIGLEYVHSRRLYNRKNMYLALSDSQLLTC